MTTDGLADALDTIAEQRAEIDRLNALIDALSKPGEQSAVTFNVARQLEPDDEAAALEQFRPYP